MSKEELGEQGFVRACALSDIPEIMPRKVTLDERAILLCRTPHGGVSAVDELCPHKRLSMAFGVVHDGKIICPHHQYAFDLETGRSSMRRCAPVEVHEARVEGEEVFVRVVTLG